MYGDFAKVAGLRFSSGETNLLEKTTAEAKRNEISMLFKQVEAEFLSTYSSLKTIMNTTENFEVNKTFEPMQLSVSLDTSLVSLNPSLLALYQQAVIAEKNSKLETTQTLPDFKIGYFNQSIIGFQRVGNQDVYFDGADRFTGFNIGLNIPLTFFSNSAKIKSLKLQQRSLQKAADNNKLILQNQLSNVFQQYGVNFAQYNLYRTTATVNAETIVSTATAGFRSGEIGYLEYANALQTATDIQLKYLQSIYQINQSIININLLISK